MNIVIGGGGDVGTALAQKLIFEKHNITIIEKRYEIISSLQLELDAKIVNGDISDIKVLSEVISEDTDLYIAVSNSDLVNIFSCFLAKKICKEKMKTIARVDEQDRYFNSEFVKKEDFGIDYLINQDELVVENIYNLIIHPEAIELVDYEENDVQLIGIRISEDMPMINKPLSSIGFPEEIINNIRIVAIYRDNNVIIPRGNDVIKPEDEVYIIGKRGIIQFILEFYFYRQKSIENVFILGVDNVAKRLAEKLKKEGLRVYILEKSINECKKLAKKLDNMVICADATDDSLKSSIDWKRSCFVCITQDDEYNLVSAVYAKTNKANKTISLIKNMSLVSIMNSINIVDSIFSPQLLIVGEILRFCRKGNMISITPFSEINAETVNILINEELPILHKPLSELKLPEGMIIGAIIRGNDVIIPKGNDTLELNDRIIILYLPGAIFEIEKLFSKKSGFFRV